MIKRFAARRPKTTSALIYTTGFVGGILLGFLVTYLSSGAWKHGGFAFGTAGGAVAVFLAQRQGLVRVPEERNKPISLFGPGGFHA